jgi:DNA invertase Pin-like site-specific DNA recombinase
MIGSAMDALIERMDTTSELDQRDLLDRWARQTGSRPAGREANGWGGPGRDGLRFAFYGRTSTVEYQDRSTSRAWQREVAESVIAGQGVIVAEFFDVGCSRRVPWVRRPQAGALLAALSATDRGFDAVVVGEYERAFYGEQLTHLALMFRRHGVQIWLPEAGGPVDIGSPEHKALMSVLGAQSQREVLRSRHRVLAATEAQAREQGRYLGGRPPYGYWLVDAGPHPNRAHAGWGRRCQRLDPDPVTAPHVRWMFEQRVAGRSVAGIARELNERGVLCPSDVDPDRNRHRSGGLWTLRTVAVILANPRYTGRQVWNRQRTEHSDRAVTRRLNPAGEWVISRALAHPALVSEAEFVAAQQVRAARPTKDDGVRRYLLAGLLECRLCGRRMDSHWVHGRAGYRCRHGYSSARPRSSARPKSVYVREDVLLSRLVEFESELGGHDVDDGDVRSRVAAIVAWLKAAAMVIVHDGTAWEFATG